MPVSLSRNLPLVTMTSSLRDVLHVINESGKGIALIVDDARRLSATVTDGDVRRAILAGVHLDRPVGELEKRGTHKPSLAVPMGTSHADMKSIMREASIRQLPLLDDQRRVVDLVTLDELTREPALPIHAAIMAGGFGTRLRPLTNNVPKPMLPVDGRPILEHVIEQLRNAGIKRISVTTHFLPQSIKEHFADGRAFGVDIDYICEDRPLGTAGALGLMEPPDRTILVINGDILTRVNFHAMFAFHREHGADLTVAVRQHDVQIPFGVVEADDVYITRLREKPVYSFSVNAGIYLLEPRACGMIPRGKPFDMTDLIDHLLTQGHPVVGFPIVEYWSDIGVPDSYEQAQKDIKQRRLQPCTGTEDMSWSPAPAVSSAAI